MKTELLEFVKSQILGGHSDSDLGVEDDLLASEIIDSMGVMRLIAFVEERFQITIPLEDVTIENFQSVESLSSYLANRAATPGL